MVAACLQLPVGEPLVRSHLFHAYPLAILASRGAACLPWILSTFVQLYHRAGAGLKFYVHPLSPAPHLGQVLPGACPWLDVQQLDQRLLPEPVAPLLARCLGRGLYPQLDIDHGHLPGDGRRGFLHEILVTGIDRPGGRATLLGYDAAGRFGPRTVALDGLQRAAHGARTGWTPAEAGERPRLVLFRLRPAADWSFQSQGLADLLWDYVEAAASTQRTRAFVAAPAARWGVDAVAALADAIEAGPHDPAGAERLVISLRVLWEHKRLMALRVDWLHAQGLMHAAPGLRARLHALVDEAWRLRLALLRRRRGPVAGSMRRAAGDLRALTAREVDLWGDVLLGLDAPRRVQRVA